MGLYYNPIPPHIGAQQPLTPRKLTPPQSGPQNPPFLGTRIAQAVLTTWALATIAPAPVVAKNLTPPSAPVAQPLFKRFEYSIYANWQVSAPLPMLPVLLDPPRSAPQNPPFAGTRVKTEILNAWLPPQHTAQPNFVGDDYAPWASISVPPYAPVGARVPVAVQIAWLPPLPAPITVANLDPPISGPLPQNPPRIGARVPVEVQIAWLPPQPMPILGFNKLSDSGPVVVTYVPIGTKVPVEIQVSWVPPAALLQPAIEFYTPSGPDRPPLRSPGLPSALQSWWTPPWAPPQRQTFLQSPAGLFPFRGTSVSREVLQSWAGQPYAIQVRTFRTNSGPVPSQPPLGGGARIRTEILIGWLPPPPAPIKGTIGGTTASSGYTFLPSWRVAVVPPIRKVAVVPAAVKVAIVPAIRKTDVPPRGT